MIKLIASDLDNTALNNGILSEANKEAIERAGKLGIGFVAVTGRGLGAIPRDFFDIESFNYAVTSNGASITNVRTGERLKHFTVSPEDTTTLMAIARELGAQVEIFIEGKAYVNPDYYEDPVSFGMPESIKDYIIWSRHPVDDIWKFIEDNAGEIENFAFVARDGEMHENIVKEVLEKCPDNFMVDSECQWVEIMNMNCDKGRSLKALTDYLGIDLADVAAFGDGDNDLEMLEAAGVSFAMGNASENLKRIADHITLDVKEDGLAVAINRICDNLSR